MDTVKLKNEFAFPVYALSRVLTAHYKPVLDDIDLTYPQYLVMLVLWEDQQLSVNEIGDKLLLDSGTLTPLLKKLENRQLLRRVRSTHDERVVLISLTEMGKALKKRAIAFSERISSNLDLKEHELHLLKNELSILLNRVKQVVKK
jgi:DNA-binding MarR family transcriptional regulator